LEIIVATKNEGKLREGRDALKGLGFHIRGLNFFRDIPEVEEDGKSYVENALKEARFYSKYFSRLALADDSGLEVDALKGSPGIYSARYAGNGASDRENRKKLLKEMEGVSVRKRGAGFKCVIALVSPDGKEILTEGSCRGRIGLREAGRRGFGYDPLFFIPRYGKTMAQLTLEEKNSISHRGKALRKLREVLKNSRGQKIVGIFHEMC